MKTKFYSLIAGIFLLPVVSMACGDDSTKAFTFSYSQSHHYWAGLDVGVNGYFDSKYRINSPSGYEFLELDYARSHSFAWNIGQYNFHIYKNYVNFVTGVGLEWNSYALRRNVSLTPHSDSVSAMEENFNFTKNKLKTTWVTAPLMIEFNTNNKDEDHSFHIGVGATVGYNIFQNRQKQEFNLDGDSQKRKTKDDFNVNPFRYSLTARVGYGHFSVFADYGLSTFFKDNRGPKVYPFSGGISLSF